MVLSPLMKIPVRRKPCPTLGRFPLTPRCVIAAMTLVLCCLSPPLLSQLATEDTSNGLDVLVDQLSEPPSVAPPNRTFAVFYNAYIAPERIWAGIEIITEQLKKVEEMDQGASTVYYNLIGANYTGTICPKGMKCLKLRYMETGHEVDTLQDLHDYCVMHPTHFVTYLHNKGSLHPSSSNNKIRKMATGAAISSACRSMPLPKYPCNVCSIRYQYLPHGHTPGNMWTAHCNYVKDLIPPREFDPKRRQMFHYILKNPEVMSRFPCIETILDGFDDQGTYSGDRQHLLALGRYAMEHWVFSHPAVTPCNAAGYLRLNDFPTGDEKVEHQLRPGPGNQRLVIDGEHKIEWFHLKGVLFAMKYLYGSEPNATSFIFSRYRRGKIKGKAVC